MNKKTTFKLLFTFFFVFASALQVRAELTYCNDFGQTISDNTRGWAGASFNVLGTVTAFDLKQAGTPVVGAGDIYRGVVNTANVVSVYQTKTVTVVLDKGTSSFNWINFAYYADWNADGIFDPVTEKLLLDESHNNTNRTHTITVPADAALGQTRIRIIFGWFNQNTDNTAENYYSPCKLVGSVGDALVPKNARVFDFLINIQSAALAVKAELQSRITEATTLKANTIEGTGVFQYTTANRLTLQNAIDAAQNVYTNATLEADYIAATSTLVSKIAEYKASATMPFKVSNGSTNVWYQIHDKRSPFVYWNVATVGTTPNALNRTTTADATANTQLFKFVKAPAPSMGYYIYSLTDQTNPLVAPVTDNGSIIRIEAAQPAAAWIVDVATTDYYLIKKESDLKQLNSYNDKISFYQGGSADAGNNWMFVETLPTRTVTLTSNNNLHGSAVITGTATTTFTGTGAVSVTATAASSYSFVNWTNAVGGAEVSTANPYTYNGEYTIGLVANFSFYSGLASGATALNATVSANGNKQIVVCLNTQMNATAIVYNSVGQKLIEKSINAATKEISGALKPGVYMVSIQANGNKMTQKVVIK